MRDADEARNLDAFNGVRRRHGKAALSLDEYRAALAEARASNPVDPFEGLA